MARKNQPLIIGAAVFGVAALLFTMFILFSSGGSAPTPTPGDGKGPAPLETTKQVQYEAIRDIPPRTQLTSSLFRPVDADSSNAIPGALTTLDDLNGRLSNTTIGAGQVVTRVMTVDPVARVIPANIPIPPNMRAVAIFVNPNQTAAGLVDRGDRVDVIATHTFKVSTGPMQRVVGSDNVTSGRVIAQDLLVLAVDKSIAAKPIPTPVPGAPADAPAPGAPTAAESEPQPGAPIQDASMRVLLAAPIEVATRLVAAEQDGKLHVVIRNPSTTEQFPVPEAQEYPSRVVQNPMPQQAGGGGPKAGGTTNVSAPNSGSSDNSSGTTRRRRNSDDDMMGEPPPRLPAPNMNTEVNLPPAPIPPANNNAPSVPPPPAAAPEKEITVIRGTEKTRVIVPR